MLHTTLQRLTFLIHFSYNPMRHHRNFLKVTWVDLTPIPQTNFSIWTNLPKTPFWQVHNVFFIHFQDNMKTWSGMPKINLQDPHVPREFTLTHNLGQASFCCYLAIFASTGETPYFGRPVLLSSRKIKENSNHEQVSQPTSHRMVPWCENFSQTMNCGEHSLKDTGTNFD